MADDTQQAPANNAPAPTPSAGDQALGAAAQQVSQPHTALPAPMPQQPHRIDRASGLLGMITADITNAVAAHKEQKIQAAMGNYMAYANAHTRAEDIVNKSGVTDPQKRQQMMTQLVQADPSVKAIFSGQAGQKNVKAMKDILKVDFTDPESMNTVQHQALQRVTKAIGMQKVMAMLGTLRQQHQQQLQGAQPQQQGSTPEQQQQSYQRTVGRAESQATPLPTDVKGATEVADSEAKLTTARAQMVKDQADARDKYSAPVVTTSGKVVVYDKSDPNKAIELQTKDEKGNMVPVSSTPKGTAGDGKILFSPGGPPYAINHYDPNTGKMRAVTPGDALWTGDDEKSFQAANASFAAGNAIKDKRLAESNKFKQTYYGSLPWSGIDTTTGKAVTISRQEAADPKNRGRYVQSAEGDKIMKQQSGYAEIDATVKMVNDAIELPNLVFDSKTRAQLAAATRTSDPSSALNTFLNSEAADTLNNDQVDYITAIASMYDSANRLINVSGGQRASDSMRAATRGMLPTATGPNKAYIRKQMQRFGVELNTLRQGTPGFGNAAPIQPATNAAPPGATSPPAASGKGNSRVIKYDAQGNRIQ